MKGVDKCKYCGNDNEFKLIPRGPHMAFIVLNAASG